MKKNHVSKEIKTSYVFGPVPYHIINHSLIRSLVLLLLVVCLSSCSLSSCSLFKLTHVNNYEDFAEVANTIWANLYFKIAKPQTPYDGLLYKDTRWRKKDSPVMINGSLFVFPGVTLTIEPGVTVKLGKDALLRCQGVMVARGTEAEPILFTRQQEGENEYWNAIEFNNCVLKQTAGEAKVVLENCIVEYGQGLFVNSSTAEISSCVFRENISTALKFEYAAGVISRNKVYNNSTQRQCETGNGAGINVYTDKTVLVDNNEIYDNFSANGRDGGGGIYAFAYNEGKVTVVNNTVRNNASDRRAGGIFAYASEIIGNTVSNNQSDKSGGGIFAIDSVVKENIVTGNRSPEGGGIYSERSQLINNLIQGNTADNGAGLYHLGDGLVQYNSFTDNYSAQPGRSIAITLSGNPVLEDNNIITPEGYALKYLSHNLSPDLKAHNNFWGTTDETVIERLIYDWLEDTQVGLVSWKNYRPAAVDEAYPVADPESLKTGVTAETVIPDTLRAVIETDTILGETGIKHYTVIGNLLVQEGVSLSITAGTELFLKKDASIRVRGQLTAVGDQNNPVRFTGNRQEPWGQIFFESRSLDFEGQTVAAQTENRLDHCIIENGSGLLMDGYGADVTNCVIKNNRGTGIRIKEAEVTVKNCRIHDNVSDSDGGGIYVYSSKNVFIHDNTITGNTAADGGGIFSYGYLSNVAVDIRNNLVSGNTSLSDGGGIWTSRSALVDNTVTGNQTEAQGGGIYATFALIEKNRVSKNTAEEGGGVFAEANSSLIGNTIADNACRGQMGGGVFLNFWGLSLHNKTFANNTIEKNTAAGSDGAGGVVINGEMLFAGNVITGNSGFQLYNQNPADARNITAKDCYWGAADESRINALIYDGLDDPSLTVVDYKPFARTKAKALSTIVEPVE